MNAIVPERCLRVVETACLGPDLVAVLGHDIRTKPEVIASYCITHHKPVFEDLATLVESMPLIDRTVTRRRSDGWSRRLTIELPVFEIALFRRPAVVDALTDAAWFLTGDHWSFEFDQRKGAAATRQSTLSLPQSAIKHVIPFSDGLDSFAQVRLSVREHGKDAVILIRSGLSKDKVFFDIPSVRVPRSFGNIRLREVSYRTRPLIFYSFAAIAACITQAETVVIGENGQGALGPACLPFANEWWHRNAYPAFVSRWENVLRLILDAPIRFEMPQVWRTKGQVLTDLREEDFLSGWEHTNSCATRPAQRYGHKACGICGGCLLRSVSTHAARLAIAPGHDAFDPYALKDEAVDREGKLRLMTRDERNVAARTVAVMSEFAQLADAPDRLSVIRREACLIDSVSPGHVEERLNDLMQYHRHEWGEFMNSVPKGAWLRELAEQL